jgi:hypothetical protein
LLIPSPSGERVVLAYRVRVGCNAVLNHAYFSLNRTSRLLGFWAFGLLGFWAFGLLGFWAFGLLEITRPANTKDVLSL